MSKIDQMPDYTAKLGRTGHSLSHKFAFTACPAYLLPVFHDFLNPGESVTLGFDFQLRTQPLEAAAMSNLRCHTEYFFVPMQLLYQGFSDWYYGINEQFSSAFTSSGKPSQMTLPKIDLAALYQDLFTDRAQNVLSSGNTLVYAGESVAKNAFRLFEMLGFRADGIVSGTYTDISLNSIFPYQLLAYNCIYQNYYRLDNRELFAPDSFNVDKYYSTGIIPHADYEKFALLKRRPFDSDYFSDIKVSPIVDVLNLNNKYNLDVAYSYLSRDGAIQSGDIGDDSGLLTGAPFDISRKNPSSYIQTQFGFDAFTSKLGSTDIDLSGITGNSIGRYTLEDGSVIPGTQNANLRDANLVAGSLGFTKHDHTFSALGSVDDYSIVNGLDIGTANIRAMFASEKLWSVTGRAKKKYDDQTLAHFGFKVPHDVKHEISMIGHDVKDIAIGEVISTSNTSSASGGSPLGEIAGKGYANQMNTRHKFTAPCHGVIMAIFSVVPDEYYEDTFLKANKFSSRDDLYTPEYDHLGMQPLFMYEITGDDTQSANEIVGWQYRYEQWKRRYNRVTSIFRNSAVIGNVGSLSSWFHSINPYFGDNPINMPNTISYDEFLHKPDELNDLFLYQYNLNYSNTYASHPEAVYEGDPFVVSGSIDCVKVSTMSDYSLPRLDA